MGINELLLLVLFVSTFGCILSGVPAMLAISGVPLIFALMGSLFGAFDLSLLSALPQRILGITSNTLFIAVPLFVMMGVLLERSGLARQMIGSFSKLAGTSPSRTSLAVIAISALVAASTGVVGASIVMLGIVGLPALLRAGVPMRLASGLVCACGTLGQIIPPSIVLIVLADQVSNAHFQAERAVGNFSPEPVTVSDLFAAALVPGLLLVFLYAIYTLLRLRLDRPAGDSPAMQIMEAAPFEESASPTSNWIFLVPLALIIAVLGSILFGIATATEASSLGAGAILLLAAIHQRGSGKFGTTLLAALRETSLITGMIFGIVIAASVLSLIFRGFGGDDIIAGFLSNLPGGKWGALFLVMAIIFLLGFVLEFIEIIFIVIPLVGPVLLAMDIDPLWLAVLVAMNLQTSFLTPPFGIALFYFRDVAPKSLGTVEIYRAIVPFVFIQLLGLAMVAYWPELALYLPRLLFG